MPADVPGVIMILPYMEAGGTERHALHLVRGLLRDYRVGLLSPDGPMLDRFLELGVAHRAFPRLEQDPLGGCGPFAAGCGRCWTRCRRASSTSTRPPSWRC